MIRQRLTIGKPITILGYPTFPVDGKPFAPSSSPTAFLLIIYFCCRGEQTVWEIYLQGKYFRKQHSRLIPQLLLRQQSRLCFCKAKKRPLIGTQSGSLIREIQTKFSIYCQRSSHFIQKKALRNPSTPKATSLVCSVSTTLWY